MADAGGGHFYFIGDVAQMRDHITSEVGETLEVVAREVVLELGVPDAVRVEPLTPFRVEQRGGAARVFLGDMVSGQAISIVLRVTFDYGEVGREVGVDVRVADRDGAFAAATPALEPVIVGWRYGDHAANDAQPRDRDVDRVVAQLFAERAKQAAVRLNREGRYDEAEQAIEGVRTPRGGLRGQGRRSSAARRGAPRGAAAVRGGHARDDPQAGPLRVEREPPVALGGRPGAAAQVTHRSASPAVRRRPAGRRNSEVGGT